MKTKSLFASKTFWVNFIMTILAIATIISPDLLTTLGIDSLKALKIIAAITGVLNIILRLLTNTAIGTAIPPTTNA